MSLVLGKRQLRLIQVALVSLLVSLLVPISQSAEASSVVFSNLDATPIRTNAIMRSNISAGMLFTASEDSTITQVRWKVGNTDSDAVRLRVYTSSSNRPATFLGELTQSAFDSAAKIRTYSGSVSVTQGNVWLVFQCANCANQEFALTSSTSKSGTWGHTFTPPPAALTRVFWLTDSANGLTTPTSSYQWSEALVMEVTATPAADTEAPTLVSSIPADNSTSQLTGANLTLNFSEAVDPITGKNFMIVNESDPTDNRVIAADDPQISGWGTDSITINPADNLLAATNYHLLIDSGAFADAAGNLFAGISAQTTLNFATVSRPSVTSSSPSDGAEAVANNTNFVLNFPRQVAAVATKYIHIINSGSNQSIDIQVDGPAVSGSGTSQITINPPNDLDIGANYHVTIDEGAFQDVDGLASLAISDPTTLNFKTAKIPYSGLSIALDASISSSYGGTGSTWSDLSGSGNNLTLYNSPTFVNNGTDPKAFAFNGTSQYGDFGAVKTGLLDENKYTKLVWFKPQGFADRNNLFSSSGANGSTNNAHAFWGGGNNAACTAGSGDNLASGHNGLWFTVVSSECLETEWQLGVVTFTSDAQDPNAGWRLYRNGILVGSSADRTAIGNTTYETRIASYSGGNFFEGQISQVYLYDRALTSSEINAIYEATSSYFGLNLNTVTFNPSGGTVDLVSLRTNAGDGRVTLRTPTKANATFLGWYTDPTSGTRVGGGGDSYDPEGNDVTLYARWDNSYTVTYSSGTNATGAPASAGYLDSTGPLTLPTPTRADYVFEGWYSAATGGTKIGNAGASYTPSADVTLHGRWTQASLAGIPTADLSEVNSTTIQAGVASSNTHTIGSSSVAVNIPANAFSAGVVVRVYSVANHNRAAALLPNESDFVNSMVVAWTAPDTTVPVASSALTMVITDANIKSGAKVYSIVGDQSTLLATATQDGTVTISFTTDPLLTIANPVIAPAPAPSSGGGGGGATGGSSAPVEPVATKLPSLLANQILEVVRGGKWAVEIKGANLDLITAVSANGKDLVFSLLDSEALLVYVEPSTTGVLSLELTYKEGKLTQTVTVREALTSRVNAGTFRGVVALYAKGLIGKRFSAKVGKDWVVVDSLKADFVRLIERVGAGKQISVKIYVDRRLERTVNLLTK